MLREANMNQYLHLKCLLWNAFKLFIFTEGRAERYSAYKIKVLHNQYERTSDFTTSTITSTRKCLS